MASVGGGDHNAGYSMDQEGKRHVEGTSFCYLVACWCRIWGWPASAGWYRGCLAWVDDLRSHAGFSCSAS